MTRNVTGPFKLAVELLAVELLIFSLNERRKRSIISMRIDGKAVREERKGETKTASEHIYVSSVSRSRVIIIIVNEESDDKMRVKNKRRKKKKKKRKNIY